MNSVAPVPMLSEPLPNVAAWTAHLMRVDLPVLGDTADHFEVLRANEDDVDANLLGERFADDPLMTLKIMAYASTHRHARLVTDVETVTAALVLMGITPFFEAFGPQPTVEAHLADHPIALEGLRRVVRRAHRAAKYALAIAIHRMDPDAAIIHQAALLHDAAEMLVWCQAPTLAERLQERLLAHPSEAPSLHEQAVLNIRLSELQLALVNAWALPELVVHVSNPHYADQPAVRNVLLAVRLARHSEDGWTGPALTHDYEALGELLMLSPAAAETWIHNIGL